MLVVGGALKEPLCELTVMISVSSQDSLSTWSGMEVITDEDRRSGEGVPSKPWLAVGLVVSHISADLHYRGNATVGAPHAPASSVLPTGFKYTCMRSHIHSMLASMQAMHVFWNKGDFLPRDDAFPMLLGIH